MKYIKEYLKDVIKVKPLGELTTKDDELNGISGEMVYIDGKCSDIFIAHIDYVDWFEKQSNKSINIDIESMVSSYKQRLKNQAGIKMENNPLVNMCLSAFRRGVENTLEELNLRTLEKQGEQKPVEPQQDMLSQEKYAKAVDECIYGEQKPVNVDYVSGIREELLSIEDSAENIVGLAESQWVAIRAAYRLLGEYIAKEQKLADKVEPKFKVGDWISNDMCDAHIASIENGMYYFDEGDGLSIVFVDEHYHLWTIEDAMDGDVLVSRSPFIYGKQCPYGGLNWCNNKFIKASNFIFTDSPVHPATKEQRDFLFQKMEEAGYTFDFKNKELKKIKNDIEIPFGAKDSELQEATYYIPKGFHAEIDDDKVVIKKGEKPTAWSKKDEKMFKYALNMIEWYSGKNEDKSRYVSDWLKSLKQRIGG